MRRGLVAAVAALALALCACSDSGDKADANPSPTTASDIGEPDPPIPAGINPIPYDMQDLVALGNIQLVVYGVDDMRDADPHVVEVDLEVRNRGLESIELRNDSFRVYELRGSSSTPQDDALSRTLASDERVREKVRFVLAERAEPLALVFNGASYGERVLSGAISLDPDYEEPPSGES
jgi:hypothetical protein